MSISFHRPIILSPTLKPLVHVLQSGHQRVERETSSKAADNFHINCSLLLLGDSLQCQKFLLDFHFMLERTGRLKLSVSNRRNNYISYKLVRRRNLITHANVFFPSWTHTILLVHQPMMCYWHNSWKKKCKSSMKHFLNFISLKAYYSKEKFFMVISLDGMKSERTRWKKKKEKKNIINLFYCHRYRRDQIFIKSMDEREKQF